VEDDTLPALPPFSISEVVPLPGGSTEVEKTPSPRRGLFRRWLGLLIVLALVGSGALLFAALGAGAEIVAVVQMGRH
jgi:hypothetical protein